MRLTPVQKDVDYSRPAEAEVAKCKVLVLNLPGQAGWVVEDPQGLILRKFVDTNGDNKVDRWCYFRDGLEVYRDIDADFNGRVDQYRWFHTAGTKWGLDRDEDGLIDGWHAISPEEASAEAVAALAEGDSQRFARLLITAEEVKSLGLGQAKAKELLERVAAAPGKFRQMAGGQNPLPAKARWVQFSAQQPGTIPAGTDGSTRDLQVYENVLAIVEAGTEHSQVQIGTLVRVGEAWKLIDAPQVVREGQAPGLSQGQADLAGSGFFFRGPQQHRAYAGGAVPSQRTQQILAELEKLDAAGAGASTPEQQAAIDARRADLVERLIAEADQPEQRAMWVRQLADMLSAAVQSGGYPDGLKRLEALLEQLQKSGADKSLVGYVKFRQLTAEYGLAMQAKGADFVKIQSEWLKRLEQYVADYPQSPDSAEAMLQLAVAQESAGQEEQAGRWYARIVAEFPGSMAARKAAGAQARLGSVGRVWSFQAKGLKGETIDLASLRGRVVLIQYWASWCGPCKADMPALKELLARYGPSLAIVGVNLDSDVQTMNAFLEENPLPWPQVFEEGGLESRPALELGILTLPTMILLDQQGRVVSRNITATELAAELKRLIR